MQTHNIMNYMIFNLMPKICEMKNDQNSLIYKTGFTYVGTTFRNFISHAC